MKTILVMANLEHAARLWRMSEARVGFELFHVAPQENGEMVYFLTGGNPTSDPNDPMIDILVFGDVAADGCTNFIGGGDSMIHACGRSELEQLLQALGRVHDEAGRMLAPTSYLAAQWAPPAAPPA